LPYLEKSVAKNPKEEDDHETQLTTDRGTSKTSRASIDVYEKRVLHLSKMSKSKNS
jgi:hypothetical protein